jgi:hypothetical protein
MCVKGRSENEDVSGGDRSICIQALAAVLNNSFQVKNVLELSFVQNNKENNEFIEANRNNAIVNTRYCP